MVIGQTGGFSGLVGQSTGNMKLGLTVWAKYINSLGGLQCHPVQVYQEDDGSDPSKSAANVNDLVSNKHAVAIVGADIPIVIAAAQSEADQLGVPIVGGDLVPTNWTQDPNTFPQGGDPLSAFGGALQAASRATHLQKVALLYCVEAAICGVVNQNFAAMAKAAGVQAVGSHAISLTQASFTSECQSAKSEGAQIMFTVMDSAALARLVTSCDSISYTPVEVASAIALAPSVFQNPDIRNVGLFFGSSELPFVSSSPAMQTVSQAFQKFTGSGIPDENAIAGWTSGALFGAAVNALGSAARSGPITTAMVYQGLYALKNADLGGLVPPLQFYKGKTPRPNPCYAALQLTSTGAVKSATGDSFVCS